MTATEDRWTVDTVGALARPDGSRATYLNINEADLFRSALDAEYARRGLPDGVELHRDGSLWALGRDIPDGWERRVSHRSTWYAPNDTIVYPDGVYEVRPPQTPPTVRVPWQQSIGRTLPNGKEIIGADDTTVRPRVKYGTVQNAAYTFVDADGTVEVLA